MLSAFLMSGCVYEPLETDLNTRNIYPIATDTYDIGSIPLQYDQGYFREIYLNGVLLALGVEVDPIFTASPAFGITALDIAGWNAHPGLVTGVHGVGAGEIVGTTLVQELDGKTLDSSVGKGTWTASGTWKLPAMFFNGDITTDRWLNQNSNTFLGVSAAGVGNLAHTGGAEGYSNTGFGYQSLMSITTGYFNTAIGADSLDTLTTGIMNTALGQGSMLNLQDGTFNTGIGVDALATLVTGDRNTALGMFAGDNCTGDGNVFLGYSAGYHEAGSNTLYIDNSDTIVPLIYGDFSTNDITVNGDFHVSAGSIDMSQIAVEPGSTADRAGIYAYDLSADNCTIGFFTEQAVEVALGVASTNRMPIRWNGATYYLLAEASGFYSPIAGTTKPTVSQGLHVGLVFYNTSTDTWEKCTSLSPETWVPISGAKEGVSWGSITGTLSAQTDLNDVLIAKESTSNKGSASGYAPLDADSKVPLVNLGGVGADNTKYLRGDQTWATPTALATWGSITGILSNQLDLQGVLDSKLSAITVDSPLSGAGTPASHLTVDLSSKQNVSSILTALAGLSYSSSTPFVKMTGASSFSLDTATYITGNQNINLSGDLSGSGATSISGTVTGIQGKGITLSTGFLKYSGSAWTFDNSTYLTGNQNITLSGDASGSGTTAISVTNSGLKGVALPALSTGYLYYNGSAWVFQTPSGGSADPVATIDIFEEFMMGLLTSGNIGDLGWGLMGTAPTYIASVANHNGIRQLPTTTTSGAISALWLGSAHNNDVILQTNLCDFTFVVRLTDITSDTAFVGAMDAMGTAVGNQDRYGFEYIDSSDTYWMMVTGTGSASTRTATSVTVTANTWYKLRVVRTATGVDYYINDSLVGTITTTLPDTALSFGFHIQTNTTVAKYLQCDFFRMTLGVTR